MSTISLTRADAGRRVEATPKDLLVLRLDENPTTGYRWAIQKMNETLVDLVSSEYEPASGSTIGAAGQRTFTFRVKKAGTATVQVKLSREWEKEESISESMTFTVEAHE